MGKARVQTTNHKILAKRDNTLFILAAVAIGYYLYTRSATVANLNFVPRGLSMNGAQVQVTVGVQNTSSNPITLNSLSANLLLNGNNIGNVANFISTVIAPNAETPIQLFITPNIAGDISSALSQLNTGGAAGQSFTLVGTANVNGAPLPVSVQL